MGDIFMTIRSDLWGGRWNGRDLDNLKQAHVDDPYVVSIRCSRFEERKKCACEHERAQVTKGERKE